jgi:hypothetical protein
MPELIGLGGNKAAKRQAEAQQRTQLAAVAKQTGEAEQAVATGGRRRGTQMLQFARSLSGDGESSFG